MVQNFLTSLSKSMVSAVTPLVGALHSKLEGRGLDSQ